MPVLRNPVYFIFIAFVLIGAYVTYNLNLWGPMLNMANAASAQALEEGKKRLREFLESNETARSAIGMPSALDESIEMKKRNATRSRDEDEDDEI